MEGEGRWRHIIENLSQRDHQQNPYIVVNDLSLDNSTTPDFKNDMVKADHERTCCKGKNSQKISFRWLKSLFSFVLAGLAVLWIPPVKITIRNRQIIVRICQITVKNRCHSTLYIISRPQYTYIGVNKYHVCRLLRTQSRLAQFMGLLCSINTDLVRRTNIFSCYLFFTFRDKL